MALLGVGGAAGSFVVASCFLLACVVAADLVAPSFPVPEVAARELAAREVLAPDGVAILLSFPAFGAALDGVFGVADLAARAALGAAVVTLVSTGLLEPTPPSCAGASAPMATAPRDGLLVPLATPLPDFSEASGAASTTVPGRSGDDRTRDQVRSPRSARLP